MGKKVYSKPEKVVGEYLDPKKVCANPDGSKGTKPIPQNLLIGKQKKAKAEVYDMDSLAIHSTIKATDFIKSTAYLDILGTANVILLDDEKWKNHEKTTEEVEEYMKDVKVLGPRELRVLLRWRKSMLELLETERKALEDGAQDVKIEEDLTEEQIEAIAMAEIDEKASEDEKAASKKKKKMAIASARKRKRAEGLELSKVKKIRKAKELAEVTKETQAPDVDMADGGSDNEEGLGDGERETIKQEVEDSNENKNELIYTANSDSIKKEEKNVPAESGFEEEEISGLVSGEDEEDKKKKKRQLRVHFEVDVQNLHAQQSVYVVGSCAALGAWEATRAMPLVQDPDRNTRWKISIVSDVDELKFRYFIGYYLNSDQGEKLIVDKWEAFLNPRSRNAESRADGVDLFGYYEGRKCVSDGWLQHPDENQISLRLHGTALKFYETSKERKNCRVKMTPMDERFKSPPGVHNNFSYGEGEDSSSDEEDEEEDPNVTASICSHSATQVAVLSDTRPKFYDQEERGVIFNNNNDYLVFRTRCLAVEFLAFYIKIFSEARRLIGACYMPPSALQDASGTINLPFINSSGYPIGEVSFEYLCVPALTRLDGPQLMDQTYCHHWRKRNTSTVGHWSWNRENTINSLNSAEENGADYVEFNVQLTKDQIAVIYHDFHVSISVAKRDAFANPQPMRRAQDDASNFKLDARPIKDLKLSQLKFLMHENGKKLVKADEREEDFKPFPTLVEALAKVNPDVGFNVEVKYPRMQNNGKRNLFVDIVLTDVMKHAGNRRIIFSSHDPDICTMIVTKQNRYPVVFVCVGQTQTQRYTPIEDQSTSLPAVHFAAGAGLFGINFSLKDLLKNPRPVEKAKRFGIVTFVRGADVDKKEKIEYFRRVLGVDEVVCDQMREKERCRNVK